MSKLPRVEVLPIAEAATTDPHNVNKHTQRGTGLLGNSLRKRGAFRSIASAGKGVKVPVVMAGNLTLEVAADAGFTEVVNVHVTGNQLVNVVRDDLEPNSAAAIALGLEDNEIGKQSYNPDIDILAAVMADPAMQALREEDKMLADLVAGMFSDDDGPGYEEQPADAEPQIDRAAELNKKWQVQAGDLWRIGEHRLLCGDSSNDAETKVLFQEKKAQMCFTDPPYGVNVTGAGGKAIAGDITFTAIPLFFACLDREMEDGAWIYVCGGHSNFVLYSKLWERHFRQLPRLIIWDKENIILRHNGYHSQCELIFCGWKGKGGDRWYSGRTRDEASDVWRCKVEHGDDRFHVTQKPIEIPMRAIRNSCPPGGMVYDPFLGSGATMVAAQNLSRKCYGIEIAPDYCAVILERMQAAFPELTIKKQP